MAQSGAAMATPPPQQPKPREEPAGMEEEARLLEAFASLPAVSRAWAFPAATHDGVRVTVQLQQRNLAANAQRKYLTSFLVNEAVLEAGALDPSPPAEQAGVLLYAPSPSGRHLLVVRAGSGDSSAVLELWDQCRVVAERHVPQALHGAVYNDGWFGQGASWSHDESLVAYVAEAPPPAKTPEWCAAAAGPDGKKAEGAAAPKGWRGQGEWSEDWGELNTGKKPPTLFVLDWGAAAVRRVQGLPQDASCGQPVWAPQGDALVFVSWQHQSELASPNFPQRLGLVHCFNRPCSLHALPWPQPAADGDLGAAADAPTCLTAPLASAFSPRFSPDGCTLVFLSQQNAVASGVHNATATLHSLSWAGAGAALAGGSVPPPRTVVDTVWKPASTDGFPGLYCTSLPEQPFLPGSHTLLLTTQWRSLAAVVAVDMQSGGVSRVSPANGASWSLLASHGGWVVACESRPSQPFALFAAHLPAAEQAAPTAQAWGWSSLPLPDADAGSFPPAVRQQLQDVAVTVLQVAPPTPPTDVALETVVLHSSAQAAGPRPTIITPHGGPHTAYLAQYFMPLSYLVALGYNVVLLNYRGSTGFGEASIQSLPGKIGASDVADCLASLQAAVDAGGSRVRAPLFFMLGAKDRRVPLDDAKQYINALRRRKDAPETRVIVFPEDSHALDKPQTEFEQWLNAAWWCKRFV
ncbi:hypothetical protein CHLNCDRAFT_134052 [Chlorella variabilis]|uniref:acylaminoacyl-peptidase n=1 Tax=Chlorella variabilis TaxID=554065 RepID=E1ZEW2_CHLVA|nr:hypothetical protein CHLNCDRAFT_134052 [Chlorella variabilis]EFN55568.1 hypothetical protein CHLNCDRAFT_134052 [Chlorella variabilis]|eukprot:XP_005847670.1 hypothetical protein CHLNCDRAFT_134052 [Chlorella variabilis]